MPLRMTIDAPVEHCFFYTEPLAGAVNADPIRVGNRLIDSRSKFLREIVP